MKKHFNFKFITFKHCHTNNPPDCNSNERGHPGDYSGDTAILKVIPHGPPDAGKHKDVVNFTDIALHHQPGFQSTDLRTNVH